MSTTNPLAYSAAEPARDAAFELRAGLYAPGVLRVLRFDGTEAMNGLYAFDVVTWTRDADEGAIEAAVLGKPAALCLRLGGGATRWVRGIVAAVTVEGKHQGARHALRLHLVPRMWLLHKRVNSRIFQEKTVKQIVDVILDDHGVARDWNLLSSYPARQYCVQYQETDYQFVIRLLAEEGIFFSFDHPAEETATERLVLADSAHSYAAIDGDPALVYRPQTGEGAMSAEENHVLDFRPVTRVEPTTVTLSDYDFRRPLLRLTSGAPSDPTAIPSPGRPLEIYEHHGEYEETDADMNNAGVYLEQLRAGVREAQAASVCRRIQPGRRLDLLDHEIEPLNASWVITHAEHHGTSPEAARHATRLYENRFRCAPAAVPFRPPRPARVTRQVIESAVVVGPAGQEIYTDPHGRIKVQFHWDRDGKLDEHSSCWIRVMQAWAGTGWGFQFIPRIGMEVIVGFLGGDVDRPIVTGCVYNAAEPPPYPLPADKTRSGIRTHSTPGGHGSNEISFEDQKGAEQVYLHAERDLDEVVVRNHSATIGGEEAITVAGHKAETVGKGRTTTVAGADELTVQGNHGAEVSGERHERTGKNRIDEVGGDLQVKVTGSRHEAVSGDVVSRFERDLSVVVDGTSSTTIGPQGQDDGRGDVYVWGTYGIRGTRGVEIRADRSITLTCGGSVIEMTPDKVKISTKTLELSASAAASLKGDGPKLDLGKDVKIVSDSFKLFTKGASLEMDKNAALRGDKVMLNCDPSQKPKSDSKSEDPKTKPFKMKIVDGAGQALSGKKYKLQVSGLEFEGTTAGDGGLSADVPEDATTAQITVWKSDYPTGDTLIWSVRIAALDPIDTPKGLQARLANLGYSSGPPADAMNDAIKDALRHFQLAQNLASTGELDADTKKKLESMHD